MQGGGSPHRRGQTFAAVSSQPLEVPARADYAAQHRATQIAQKAQHPLFTKQNDTIDTAALHVACAVCTAVQGQAEMPPRVQPLRSACRMRAAPLGSQLTSPLAQHLQAAG
jgi:hypothetical protein